jgi:hypothetical protein
MESNEESQACQLQRLMQHMRVSIDKTHLLKLAESFAKSRSTAEDRDPESVPGKQAPGTDARGETLRRLNEIAEVLMLDKSAVLMLDQLILDKSTSLDFTLKSYKVQDELGCLGLSTCTTVLTTIALNNILAFPVRIQSGNYSFWCAVPPPTSSSEHFRGTRRQLAHDGAISVSQRGLNLEILSRNALEVEWLLSLDKPKLVGERLVSPALVGKPFLLVPRARVTAGGDSVLMQMAERLLEAVWPAGIQIPAVQQPPAMLTAGAKTLNPKP